MNKSNKLYLEHVLLAIDKIERLSSIEGLDLEAQNLAVERCLAIIGDAVAGLSDEFKMQHSEIEWRDIKDFRNQIIHNYFNVDYDILWDVVENELPKLKAGIEKIIKEFK